MAKILSAVDSGISRKVNLPDLSNVPDEYVMILCLKLQVKTRIIARVSYFNMSKYVKLMFWKFLKYSDSCL